MKAIVEGDEDHHSLTSTNTRKLDKEARSALRLAYFSKR